MGVKISEQIESRIRFILSQVDRDKYSKTYGCCDRLFWGWKLKDYPDATLQRYAYCIARYFHGKDKLNVASNEIITSIIKYTGKLQHSDGSLDQAFPNEHSHGATAFLLFDLARTYQLVEPELNEEDKKEILSILTAMGELLVKTDEKHGFISNHLLGAGAALMALYKITNSNRYKERAKYYVQNVINHQSQEGWFLEYEGADPGYQTLGIYYLAHYYKETKDEAMLHSLQNAVDFASYFVHPDGSFGGEYGSRNTEVFYPGGFAILKEELPVANDLLSFMMHSAEFHQTVNLDSIDVWNLAPLLNNYMEVSCEEKTTGAHLKFNERFIKEFSEAGIVIFSGEESYNIIGISKGGVVKSFSKKEKKIIRDDCGYIGFLNGKLVSTQKFFSGKYALTEKELEMEAEFFFVEQSIPNPGLFAILRTFNLSLGNFQFFRELFKRLLVGILISNKKKTGVKLHRRILLSDNLQLVDKIIPTGRVENLEGNRKFSTMHMASSKYWQGQI